MKIKGGGKSKDSFGNDVKKKKFLTPIIAAAVFIVYIIISLLLAQGNVQKFIIILLLLGVISLCGYFIYVIWQNDKKKKENPEFDEISDVTPRRSSKPAERPVRAGSSAGDTSEEEGDVLELRGFGRRSRAEADIEDRQDTEPETPVTLDPNNVRIVKDRVIIRKGDPTEADLEEYRAETEEPGREPEDALSAAADTDAAETQAAEADDDSHYVRKTVERPAFQGFVRTRSKSETLFSGSINNDATLQAREAFNAARTNAEALAAEAAAAEAAREAAVSAAADTPAAPGDSDTVLQRAAAVQDGARTHERVSLSDKYKSGPRSDIYKESYDSNKLFRGSVDVEKPMPGNDQKSGFFGGKGYRSPFDRDKKE